MAIQTVDFSTINNVTKDGLALTQVVLDGVTLWTSNYVGQTWQQQGQTIFGDLSQDFLGKRVSLSGDGSRLAIGITGGGPDADGSVKIYFWNGSFWALEQEIVATTDPISNTSFGDFVLLSDDGLELFVTDPNYDNSKGRIQHFQRSGTVWSTINNIFGPGNGGRLGQNLLGMSANNAFVWTTNGNGGVYWSSSVSLGTKIDDLSGYNAAINKTDGTVVAINEPNLTRNGHANAGEIRVYEGAIGVRPSNPKGLPITGTAPSAYLGGITVGSQKMCLDAAGDRLFATHVADVHVYDFIGGLWSLSHIITPTATPNSIDITSDGLRLAVSSSGGVSVYAENGGVWDLINPSVVATSLPNPSGVVLSEDGTHFAAGDYLDDTNGTNAGAAAAYTLI
jgi:hypothetical protein